MPDIRVIKGEGVDLISPFPVSEVDRIYGWIRSFKNVIEFDGWLRGRKEYKDYYINTVIPNTPTYGIIDKKNKAIQDVNFPLVGMFMANAPLPFNIYLEFTSNLKALGSGVMDEAIELAKKDIFEQNEKAVRISAWVLDGNRLAFRYLKNHGFEKEGRIKNMITQRGEPKAVYHLGILKND